ncbi:MAG: VWA domain-containing protein [Pyrinomonadaceae bacterium]
MRKIILLVLLLSLFALAPFSGAAQTRERRAGQQSTTPATKTTTAPISAEPRPPILRRQTNTNGAPQTQTSPASTRPTATTATTTMQQEIGDDDVVRINTTLVTVPVSITDRRGRYISDLRKEDFRIYENGVEQNVAYFAAVEKPFTVVLMLDTSASTRSKLDEIKDAAIAFVDQLRADDQVMVVSFAGGVTVLTEPTSDRQTLRAAIRRTSNGSSTHLYDAMDWVMKKRIDRLPGRKAIVLFTDGVDATSSHASYKSNVHDAEELDALIFPIQYDTYDSFAGSSGGGSWPIPSTRGSSRLPSIIFRLPLPFPFPNTGGSGGGAGTSRADYDRGAAYLRDMAEKTGGRVYRAEYTRDLPQAFAGIAEELRRQYSLGYYPQTQAQAGERRQIKVRVNRPELAVRARDSYVYKAGTTPATAQDQNGHPAPTPELRKRQFNAEGERISRNDKH